MLFLLPGFFDGQFTVKCVHVLQCKTPDLQPLQREAGVDDHLYMECPHCNVVAISRTNWEGNSLSCLVSLDGVLFKQHSRVHS